MPIGRKCPVESDASTDQFNNYKNQLLVEFAKGAEVFIADAQYTIDEYALRFGWGHSCIDDTVRIAIQAKVKRLVLFHHDPARDDDSMDRLLSYAQDLAASDGGGLVVEAAQEGQEIQLAARLSAEWAKQAGVLEYGYEILFSRRTTETSISANGHFAWWNSASSAAVQALLRLAVAVRIRATVSFVTGGALLPHSCLI
jgi:hypothetical protein